MLKFDNGVIGRLSAERASKFHIRLKLWLSARNVGWDSLTEADQSTFLLENDVRARRYNIHAEKTRGLLAYAFLLSGNEEAFEARDDVTEVLEDERVHEYGKARRLHAIAYEIAYGIKPEGTVSPSGDDVTFALPKNAEGASHV